MDNKYKNRRDELVRQFTRMRVILLGYIKSIVRDPHLAEDILQEASIVVINKADTYDPAKGSIEAWLKGIVRNLSYNEMRKEKYIHLMPSPELSRAIEHTFEEETSLETETVTRRLEFLEECLKEISESFRSLIHFRYRKGYRLDQIAERVGKTTGAVQVRLSRIRSRLLNCIRTREKGVQS